MKTTMSPELTAMLEVSSRARKAKRSLDVTSDQRFLAKLGKRIIRKVDGYQPKAAFNPVVPAEFCGVRGLRPTWHGRA
jgi:hypothetical protein